MIRVTPAIDIRWAGDMLVFTDKVQSAGAIDFDVSLAEPIIRIWGHESNTRSHRITGLIIDDEMTYTASIRYRRHERGYGTFSISNENG